jgi:hypothetical protein
MLDLNAVIKTTVTEEGVSAITRGAVVCAQVREGLREIIRAGDPEGYAAYRVMKYPGGEGTDTPATRIAATRFLFERARDILVPHYTPANP